MISFQNQISKNLSVDCEPWYETVDTESCVNETLVVNDWITEEEFQTLTDDDRNIENRDAKFQKQLV